MNQQFSIHFGPFSVSLSSSSKPVIDHLKKFFSGYECNRKADFILRIITSQDLPHPMMLVQKEWNPLIVNDNTFEMGPQVLQGELNFEQNEINITVHPDIFMPQLLGVLQEFLYRLYYTLCSIKHIKSCIIHGCGVIKDDIGYLFVGPHQSGKTTIGQLSNALIIHDDQVIITLDGGKLTMDSSPLPARLNLRQHPDAPCILERFFMIQKDMQFAINPLSPEKALSSLYNEIVLPQTLISTDEKAGRKRKAQLCFEIHRLIPLFELHFDKEGRFWKELSMMQWN